jgi:hypothetical protein
MSWDPFMVSPSFAQYPHDFELFSSTYSSY